MQITYQKKNGNIIHKFRNTPLPYGIGDITSMGWKVLNIEYEYKGEYYPGYKFDMIIRKNKQSFIRKKQMRELCINNLKTLLYYLIGLYIINLINILLG